MKFELHESMLGRHVNVVVVGCGGTGGYLLPMLAQMNFLLRSISGDMCGINVTAFDPSVVSITNVGRQNFWPCDIAKPKSQVLIERLNMGFGTNWKYSKTNLETCNTHDCDFLMTCTDTISSRMTIGENHLIKRTNTVWIDGGNSETQLNVCVGHLGIPKDTLKIPNWYDLYNETMKNIEDDERKSCSHEESISRQDYGVNQQCAIIMARVLWRFLRHGYNDNGLHYCDVKEEKIDSLPFDPDVWATFNYNPNQLSH